MPPYGTWSLVDTCFYTDAVPMGLRKHIHITLYIADSKPFLLEGRLCFDMSPEGGEFAAWINGEIQGILPFINQ